MPSANPKGTKILHLLHPDKANIITKFQINRINKEGTVVKFVHVKIDKIFPKLEFLQLIKSIYSRSSDQNLIIYDSLDLLRQNTYNRSVFMSLKLI